jgi:hypothetical protein
MKLKKILLAFLLFVCVDQLFWKFIWQDDRSIFNSVSSGLLLSLVWLIPIKTKAQLDDQFLRESGLQLSANENVVLQSVANQIHGNEAEGGKLFLTNQRLVFISNKSHKRQRQFERSDIASVQRHPEFPKAIVLTTHANIRTLLTLICTNNG